MKFKSRKDIFFKSLTVLMISFLLSMAFIEIYIVGLNEPINVFTTIISLSAIGLFIWVYFSTEYELTQSELKYKSGPLSGEIKIERIREIIKGRTLWSNLKSATAKNGLIIKYEKYEQIYISPKTNESFIEKILEINENIKITIK